MKCVKKTAQYTPFGHNRSQDILQQLQTVSSGAIQQVQQPVDTAS
jgi:BMFP domain-containing protein YqiC